MVDCSDNLVADFERGVRRKITGSILDELTDSGGCMVGIVSYNDYPCNFGAGCKLSITIESVQDCGDFYNQDLNRANFIRIVRNLIADSDLVVSNFSGRVIFMVGHELLDCFNVNADSAVTIGCNLVVSFQDSVAHSVVIGVNSVEPNLVLFVICWARVDFTV